MKLFHQPRSAQLCGKYDSGSEEVRVEYERMDVNEVPFAFDDVKHNKIKKIGSFVAATIFLIGSAFVVTCFLIAMDRQRLNDACNPQRSCCVGQSRQVDGLVTTAPWGDFGPCSGDGQSRSLMLKVSWLGGGIHRSRVQAYPYSLRNPFPSQCWW